MLKELRGLAYDDPKREDLLDELTVADMDNLIALGGYQTYGVDSIGKVTTFDFDGPAMNCHRSAFDGRNFEYCSEDGLLAGQIAAASIRGAQAHGVYAYMKHFSMNDQQISQNYMLCTWSTEQAIRNGSDMMLKNFDMQTNHVTDQTSATSVIAMRNACHNILYTTVNSRAYADENLNPAPPAWRTAMIVVDVIAAVAVVGLAVLAIKKYRSKSQRRWPCRAPWQVYRRRLQMRCQRG